MHSFEIRNARRKVRPRSCGAGCRTLILASIGTSTQADSPRTEFDKARVAEQAGADVVTDHSFCGNIAGFHARLVAEMGTLVSTVTCYELAARSSSRPFRECPPDAALDLLEEQARRGMDIITVHASLRHAHLALLEDCGRVIPMTSKGGGIVAAYMRNRDAENPYYEQFDRVLDICAREGVTLSLGTSFRPATVCDRHDRLLAVELETMGELAARAVRRGVRVMVEGIGHAAIDEIPLHVQQAKSACGGVPYRVLPMCTDVALGFDHISGAIAGAVAVAAGADAITCMSRAEHVGLPTIDDLKEAVIATRVAAHSGELVKLRDFSRDLQMSRTRWECGCKGDWTAAIDPQVARDALAAHGRLDDQMIQCAMCGAYCGIAAAVASARGPAPPDQPSRP